MTTDGAEALPVDALAASPPVEAAGDESPLCGGGPGADEEEPEPTSGVDFTAAGAVEERLRRDSANAERRPSTNLSQATTEWGRKIRSRMRASDSERWAENQKEVFTMWINVRIQSRGLKINDLYTDLSDGIILYNLLECLSHCSLARFGKLSNSNLQSEMERQHNVSIVIAYLKEYNIGTTCFAMDIVKGNKKIILGFIWSLILHFTALELHGERNLGGLKRETLNWVHSYTSVLHPELKVTNFTSDFQDGKVFLAIMHTLLPREVPFPLPPLSEEELNDGNNPLTRQQRIAAATLGTAFGAANKHYKVQILLDPEDPHCCRFEHVVIMYLSEMRMKLPQVDVIQAQDAPSSPDARVENNGAAAATNSGTPVNGGSSGGWSSFWQQSKRLSERKERDRSMPPSSEYPQDPDSPLSKDAARVLMADDASYLTDEEAERENNNFMFRWFFCGIEHVTCYVGDVSEETGSRHSSSNQKPLSLDPAPPPPPPPPHL